MKFLLLVLLLILSAYSVDNNMEMAKEAYLKKDYSRAFSLFKTEAESGDEKAQYNIGYMYSQGLGAYIGVFGQQCRSSTGHFCNEIF